MGQSALRYLIFETASGFCGIAWNSVGITRFQLPATSAEAAERLLLRRVPDAEPSAPARGGGRGRRCGEALFRGRGDGFLRTKLDLGEQDDFFKQIYTAARRIGWGATQRPTVRWRRNSAPGPEAARDVGQAMAKNPVTLIIPCPPSPGSRRQGRRLSRARRLRREDPHARAGGRSYRAAVAGRRPLSSKLVASP